MLKPSPEPVQRENTQSELERARRELQTAAEERENLVRNYEEYIEKLQRENRQLMKSGASERTEIGASRKLLDIETQNERIMENLRSTTATLSENERSYISKINLLFSEKQALEQQISQLQQKMDESVVQNSRYDRVRQQLKEASAELEQERERAVQLSQTEKKLQRRVDSVEAKTRERARALAAVEAEAEQLRDENAKMRTELAQARQLKDSELHALNDRLQQLIGLISSKDSEIGHLRKELTRSDGGRARPGEPRRRGEEFDLARRRNSELSKQLNDLNSKYDNMMEMLGSASKRVVAHAPHEGANPFAASDVEAARVRQSREEQAEARYTPVKLRDEASTNSGNSAPHGGMDPRRQAFIGEVRPFTLPHEQGFSAPRPQPLPANQFHAAHPAQAVAQAHPPAGLFTPEGKKDQVSRVLINGKVVYSADGGEGVIKDPAALQRYVNALTTQEMKKIRGSLRTNDAVAARPRNASNPPRLEGVEAHGVAHPPYGEFHVQGYEQQPRTVLARTAPGPVYPEYYGR